MNRLAATLCVAMVVVMGVGCVSQDQFDRMRTAYRKSQEQVIDLKAQFEESQQRNELLKNDTRNDPKLIAGLRELETENAELRRKLDEFAKRLQDFGPIGPLPAELDEALVQLVGSNPDLMTYDAELGMVKFHSDLTFDLGSVAIKPGAATSLAKLAKILSADIAIDYEVRIEGHTDNVPIRRETTMRNHPTNWHLSVHRSISVKDSLARAGVAESRVGVAGYGEHRPITANAEKLGNELNRRVELYLLPRTSRTEVELAVEGPASETVEAGADTADSIDVNK